MKLRVYPDPPHALADPDLPCLFFLAMETRTKYDRERPLRRVRSST